MDEIFSSFIVSVKPVDVVGCVKPSVRNKDDAAVIVLSFDPLYDRAHIRAIDGKTPLFKAPQGGLLRDTSVNRVIRDACRETGIEHFTCHAFRATFATRCIEQGINPRTVQELLGHSDYGITMNLYGHVLKNTLTEAMKQISIAM